jgi:hypothetical protein
MAEKFENRAMAGGSASRVKQLFEGLDPEPILGLSPQELLELILEDTARAR